MKFIFKTESVLFWLFCLALITALGFYLIKGSCSDETVQTFAGGYPVPNRSFADLFHS